MRQLLDAAGLSAREIGVLLAAAPEPSQFRLSGAVIEVDAAGVQWLSGVASGHDRHAQGTIHRAPIVGELPQEAVVVTWPGQIVHLWDGSPLH